MRNSIYDKCFVAFLDILGFKNIVKKENGYKVLYIFKNIIESQKFEENYLTTGTEDSKNQDSKNMARYKNLLTDVDFYFISDSIVVSIKTEKENALKALIDACLFIQKKLYQLNPPLLLRGAITEGDYYSETKIAFGPAMVDAYLKQENCAYPCIIISGELVEKHLGVDLDSYNLAFDTGNEYIYVNCIKDYFSYFKNKDNELNRFKIFIKNQLDDEKNEQSIREKYIWLREKIEELDL